LVELARELSTDEISIRFVADDGRLLASAGGPPGAPELDEQRFGAIRTEAAAHRGADVMFFAPGASERWQVLALPLVQAGEFYGTVEAASSRRSADDLLRALFRALVAGGLAALIVGAWGATAVAWIVTRPVERLTAAARRIASNDLEVRTGLPRGRNEIYAAGAA